MRESAPSPRRDDRDKFRDDDARLWSEPIESGAKREPHAEAADKHPRVGPVLQARAGQGGECLLGPAEPTVYELDAPDPDRELLAALHQPQLIMLARNVGAVEVDPRDQAECARDKRMARRAGDRVADHADEPQRSSDRPPSSCAALQDLGRWCSDRPRADRALCQARDRQSRRMIDLYQRTPVGTRVLVLKHLSPDKRVVDGWPVDPQRAYA